MKKSEIEKISFEEALEELEAIINRLESGEVPLDETISLYDRGSKLKEFCENKLQSAEEKIQKISKKQSDSEGFEIENI